MEYRNHKITKKAHFITGVKKYSFLYGKGNAKTTGYFNSLISAKLFIDWIIESDYGISKTADQSIYWKYKESI